MTKKECKKLAKKIAELELKIQNPETSEQEKSQFRKEMIKLCSSIYILEDMIIIDDEVQKILKNS